jgi:hypothetical protein
MGMIDSMKTRPPSRLLGRLAAACLATAALVAGCSDKSSLGPSVPSGVTELGGSPVTSAPPPPAGWNPKDVVPTSQQQAQDTLVDYLKRTLAALPAGTVLDSDGYAGPGHNIGCEDEPKDSATAPVHFQTIGNVTVPGGLDPQTVISKVGDTWRSWGWYVFERDGFTKPNQFGYGPDGYRLQIQAANPSTYPPTLQGSTPCFPGNIAKDDVAYPPRLTANG